MFSLLFSKAFLFSLIDAVNINKLKNINKICKKRIIEKENLVKKLKIIIKKVDLRKTVYLKTPIIDNECIAKFNKDILDGPKYLSPLIDSISLYFVIFFFTHPEKLLHKLSSFIIEATSFLVKQE